MAPPESLFVEFDNQPPAEIQIRINRRARRVRLRVDHDGQTVLVLPSARRWPEAKAFLAEHMDWLAGRLRAMPPHVPFLPGRNIPYLGRDHAIRHDPDSLGGVWRLEQEIIVSGQPEHLPRRVTDWLKHQAKTEILPRARHYAALVEQPVGRITVRDTKGRWGSCSGKGNLSFCWRLIMAPEPVLDYVVCHEAAHLIEHNHSRAFWALVRRLNPDFKAHESWLKRHGSGLHRYG